LTYGEYELQNDSDDLLMTLETRRHPKLSSLSDSLISRRSLFFML